MWHNDDISKVQVLENDSGTLLGGAACFALLQFHLALLLPSPGGNTSQGQSSSGCLQGGFFLGGFSKSYHLSSPTSLLPPLPFLSSSLYFRHSSNLLCFSYSATAAPIPNPLLWLSRSVLGTKVQLMDWRDKGKRDR